MRVPACYIGESVSLAPQQQKHASAAASCRRLQLQGRPLHRQQLAQRWICSRAMQARPARASGVLQATSPRHRGHPAHRSWTPLMLAQLRCTQQLLSSGTMARPLAHPSGPAHLIRCPSHITTGVTTVLRSWTLRIGAAAGTPHCSNTHQIGELGLARLAAASLHCCAAISRWFGVM